MPEPTFADRFRHWRMRADLTQQEIARAPELDMDPSSVSSWARGETYPTHERLVALVRVLAKKLGADFDLAKFFGPLEDDEGDGSSGEGSGPRSAAAGA